MKRYNLQLTRAAEKDLKKLKGHREEAARALLQLKDDPTRGHTLAGSLSGARSLEFNLKGSGAYRAVYVVSDDDCICVVFIVGPHENIYDKAERRYRALKRSGWS